MTLRKTSILVTLIALGAASTAQARGHDMNFSDLDANNDGQITASELQSHGADRFAKNDANGDGFLTVDELKASAHRRADKHAKRMLKHLDENDDGKLSLEEMRKGEERRTSKMFKHLDKDDNGSISKEEFEVAQKRMRKHHGKKKMADE